SAAGLSRHENAKHSNYNIPPIQSYILPESAINEWKEMLVHAIHKQLPLAFRKTGKQVIKFPCMEGQYLGLFGQYLTRVFVHRRAYKCVFSGSDAYQTISSLLGDHCWGVRHYKCNQVSYVVLFIQTTNESSIPALDALIAKKAAKKKKKKKKKIILVIRILL